MNKGVILIRNGRSRRWAQEQNPATAWDMTGKTIYAGFIDPYLLTGAKAGEALISDTTSNTSKPPRICPFTAPHGKVPTRRKKGALAFQKKDIHEFQVDEPPATIPNMVSR